MAVYVFLGVLAGILVPLVIVYILLVDVARSNTGELVRDKATIIIDAVQDHVTGYLDPIPEQVEEIADLLHSRGLTLDDSAQLADLFQAAMAATPQVVTLSYANADGRIFRVFRNRQDERALLNDWSDDPGFQQTLQTYAAADGPAWDGIFIAEAVQRPFITYVFPLHDDGFRGVVIASVSLEEFSRYLISFQNHTFGTPFLLRGPDNVLAHPNLPGVYDELTDITPLPRLNDLGDAALAGMWSDERVDALEVRLSNGVNAQVVDLDDGEEVFLYRELSGYDTETWYVATHLPLSAIAPQLDRLDVISTAAVAALISALVISALLSRALTRPIRQLARSMRRLGELEFEAPETASHSTFREVDEALAACDRARRSLRTFGRYVPKALMRRLLDVDQHGGRLPGKVADVTVLFTDIAGFSAMSQEMSAVQLEQFLNEHFALLNECIERFEGTTDKYIGDSLMAFWGAPDRQDDHALRACRAANAIADAIKHNNDARQRTGKDRVQLRIGIHSGSVVVGDIGPSGRVNYTVVGDTVNIAERLEELARDVPTNGGDLVAVVSRQTAVQAGGGLVTSTLGRHVLHGRRGRIEALILDLDRLPND